jgi:hypothetical protein
MKLRNRQAVLLSLECKRSAAATLMLFILEKCIRVKINEHPQISSKASILSKVVKETDTEAQACLSLHAENKVGMN